jgi:hypothetical protein
MSNDRYEKIRKALAMGPTPGPWEVVGLSGYGGQYALRMPHRSGRTWYGVEGIKRREDAEYFVACDPDTIRALLAERDRLAAENARLREDAERYRLLRKGAVEDVAVVRGLGAMDYGMSAVVATYSEEIDGDDLDAAIDEAMEKENSDARPLRENPQ